MQKNTPIFSFNARRTGCFTADLNHFADKWKLMNSSNREVPAPFGKEASSNVIRVLDKAKKFTGTQERRKKKKIQIAGEFSSNLC